MKRAALYARVSTFDQHPETQLLDLQQLARQRGLQVIETYVDRGVSGARVRRPGLDRLMADATRHRFDVVLVSAFDRMARSVRHLLETLDEFHRLGIDFVSLRENIDTTAALGRAVFTIVGAVAELEKSLIVERVKAGMRRAKLEGRQIGRRPAQVDRAAVLRDRARGLSLSQIGQAHQISRSLVSKILREAASHKGSPQLSSQATETTMPKSAA